MKLTRDVSAVTVAPVCERMRGSFGSLWNDLLRKIHH